MNITLYEDLRFFEKLKIHKSFAFSFLLSLHDDLARLLNTSFMAIRFSSKNNVSYTRKMIFCFLDNNVMLKD